MFIVLMFKNEKKNSNWLIIKNEIKHNYNLIEEEKGTTYLVMKKESFLK